MSLVRSIPFGSRRALIGMIVAVALVLLAVALTIEPASRSSIDTSKRGSAESSTAADGTGFDAAGAPGAVDPAAIDPATGASAEYEAPVDRAGAANEPRAAISATSSTAGGSAATDVMPAPSLALDAPSLDAKVIRTASLELRLRRGQFTDGWSDAHAVAGAFGGYVVTASRSGAGDGPRAGTITLRVPSSRFAAAVERLRDLEGAKVLRDDMSSQDVTQEFVDVRSRLRHDRAVEGRLLALLADTEGVSEVLAVQARLDQVQEQIELSRGRLQYLEKLTAMSTIEVALREPGAAARDRDRADGSVLAEAWRDGRDRFAENVASAIVWMGGMLPALILLTAAALVGRTLWRRRHAEDCRSDGPPAAS